MPAFANKTVTAPIFLAVILFGYTDSVHAQAPLSYRLDQSDYSELVSNQSELADEIASVQLHAGRDSNEVVASIETILQNDNLPASIRRKLTIQCAELSGDRQRKLEYLESLLDDDGTQVDSPIRGRMLSVIESNLNYTINPEERIRLANKVIEPLLATPSQEYTIDSILAVSYYATHIKRAGFDMASTIEKIAIAKGEAQTGILEADQLREEYAKTAEAIHAELLTLVETRIEQRQRDNPGQRFKDDVLTNIQAGLSARLALDQQAIARLESDADNFTRPVKDTEQQSEKKESVIAAANTEEQAQSGDNNARYLFAVLGVVVVALVGGVLVLRSWRK